MFSHIYTILNKLSETGAYAMRTEHERRDVRLFNQSWLTLVVIQVICLIAHIINGLHSAAFTTEWFIAGLCSLYFIVKRGHINAAKMVAIILISVDTSVNAIVFGEQTHVIDFLLLAALSPLYFFEIKNTKFIFGGIAICVVPFALYPLVTPYIAQYALPAATQTGLYHLITWEKIFCLVVLLYLIYNRNAHYEKEVQQKENELLGQKRLYESILEQIPIDIVTMDKDLKYTYVNSMAVKNPAIRDWLIGKSNLDYFKCKGLDIKGAIERERLLKEAITTGRAVEFEETFVDRSGRTKCSMKVASPIYNQNNKQLTGLVGYSIDITELKDAEKKLKEYAVELERKNDDMHHFVNATSHDLKSPLRNISSHLQLLLRRNAGKMDQESVALVAYTIKSVKQLNQLISDIYQYSVADRNDKPVEIADLNVIIENSLKQMDDVITSKGAEITFSQLPVLKMIPSHIGMLFSNLVGNALKYNTALKPQVMISATTTETEHVISIADNGIGIAAEYQEQIFQIFQRLHTSSEYEGTGVGLAICTKIVDNYGGKIWVESSPGKGSTFYFSLDKEQVDPVKAESHSIQPYTNIAIAG